MRAVVSALTLSIPEAHLEMISLRSSCSLIAWGRAASAACGQVWGKMGVGGLICGADGAKSVRCVHAGHKQVKWLPSCRAPNSHDGIRARHRDVFLVSRRGESEFAHSKSSQRRGGREWGG